MSAKPARKQGLLEELEDTLAHGTVARRVETLRKVTDLFVDGAADFADDQVALFDDVFECLIDHIEVSARALLARRLAPLASAPPRTLHRLADDDAIEVAGPVLSKSERLDDAALIRTAETKSQAHLLAISIRRVLSRAVTDILLRRGNDEVVHSTVSNPGADLSDSSYDTLLDRAALDENLAACLAMRPNLPRHHYLKLVAKASATVRARLEAANPKLAQEVSSAVRTAGRRARSSAVALTSQTEIAHALVRSLHADGRLDDRLVVQFTEQRKFDEANAAVAALANVPVAIAESIMIESRAEGVMILAKVAGLSWPAVESIIRMRDELAGSAPTDLIACKATYAQLRRSTAQQVLRFHRVQDTATAPQA
ncbi:DUF2336 domain-containing protein [Bradyrhizobium sp. 83002]|uniref:DUF2336 domain-containing protein n=1 Tax=Bradyrhizobium aeschynomenes TaxID=2734909 RepID=UPI001556B948|nr:DUF2336 domain-containing protein [Bradyrhizobium aeschynomenes]NPU10556.1 DUF2336 domain-containing protein [Bradyrhizobium aeschynomenes]